jgi:hypothetical protein
MHDNGRVSLDADFLLLLYKEMGSNYVFLSNITIV